MTNNSSDSNEIPIANNDEFETTATATTKDEPTVNQVEELQNHTRSEPDVAYSRLETEADAFTRFIERQRMDVFFELRRLRLGDRPVSGQSNRERIETFLTTNNQDQQQNVRVPSTRPPVPSAHIADIDALANRRCVTAALGSIAFRRDLENTIRRSVTAQPVPRVMTPVISASPLPSRSVSSFSDDEPLDVEPISITTRSNQPERDAPPTDGLERREQEFRSWQEITQLQQERIVLEISDLVHRQLVTAALESDFRQHLERNVLFRLERGAPIANLTDPPTSIQAAAPIRPPAPPAPTSSRSNARISLANLDALTSRLDSMQHMMQLMFSMQMDMQRSLRQEVASALAAEQIASSSRTNSTPVNSGHCTVCLTAVADTVLYRCGHLCVCYTCGLQLQQTQNFSYVKCPVCRAPVEDILRVYRSSQDAD